MYKKEEIERYCKNREIDYLGIVFHGSRSIGFENENSDYDYLIIVEDNKYYNMEVFITDQKEKIQIEFWTKSELINALNNYEKSLYKNILDLNFMAGRILCGKIIVADDSIYEIIEIHKKYCDKENLIRRYVYLAANFYTDSKCDDIVLKNYSYQMMAFCIGTAILIKNNIFWLSLKWQHKFLMQILAKDEFELYMKIRNVETLDEYDDLTRFAKELIRKAL